MIARRLLYWVLIALTWYLAGMYRSFPLLVLSMVELGLYVAGVVLSRVLRRGLVVRFSKRRDSCVVEAPMRVPLHVDNRSRLPITRFSACIDMRYEGQKRGEPRTVWGSADSGGRTEQLELRAPYAGLLRITLDEVRTYDWLSLSSAKRAVDETMEVFVFPPDTPLRLAWPQGSQPAPQSLGTRLRNDPGSAFEEIRQVREYRPGDPARHVHWNLSARTDSLWIREYEQQTDETVPIFADMGGPEQDAASLSNFYTLLHALMLGVLAHAAAVEVRWRVPGRPLPASRAALDMAGCQDVLRAIYETPLPGEQAKTAPVDGFHLNRNLELYMNGRLVHRFSQNGLDREIQDGIFEA